MERLQKVMATAGVCSRRAAERLIEAGRVSVNGAVVTRLGTCVDPLRDAVTVDGKPIARRRGRPVYLLLNKPRGYVTTLTDPEGRPTVADLIRDVPGRVYPIGRLDFHSEGLLLFTNDGDLAHELMHPGSGVEKTYAVKVRGRPEAEALAPLSRGIRLDGRSSRATRVRMVKPGPNSWIQVTVVEGRKHLVRRMLQAVGHPVVRLRRVRYGGVRLGKLAAGSWRHLTEAEVAGLRKTAGGGGTTPSRRGAGPS